MAPRKSQHAGCILCCTLGVCTKSGDDFSVIFNLWNFLTGQNVLTEESI